MAACTREIFWYYYIFASLISFFGGLLFLIPARLCWYAIYRKKDSTRSDDTLRRRQEKFHCFSRMRARAAHILSGRTTSSKFVTICVWLVNMAAVVLYLVEATMFTVSDCGHVLGSSAQYVWMAFSCVFVIHYAIRFAAASDKCYMWVDLYSIVDHFTLGPLFVGFVFNRNWLALRFLRILHLLQLPDILQLIHVLKSKVSIRLVQTGSMFIAVWLCASGLVHVIENNGDPHHNYANAQDLTYWECVYWLLVTMSTVGFGEITPNTDLGRAFIVLFIMGSFAMFTSIIPELASNLGRNTKFHKPYKRTYGKKHIIVCGHLTTHTVSSFIKNFMHEDVGNSDETDVVFVDVRKPGLEMEAFFKRHFNDVRFVQGTVMDLKTLEGVKLRHANACLILSDRGTQDPDGEDAANIMRATAVKNYNSRIRIIIQLLQYKNKMNLLHIPNWHWTGTLGKHGNRGDEVICVAELKNGILAQNCLAPGVSTLLSNLFTMRSYKKKKTSDWTDLYEMGAGNEIYARAFSDAFIGMTFKQAASICFDQLGILLLAVHVVEKGQNRKHLKVNPGDSVIIGTETVGYFIAQSADEMNRVTDYAGNAEDMADKDKRKVRNGRSSLTTGDHTEMEPIMKHKMSISSVEDSYLEYMETVGSRLAQYGGKKKLSRSDSGLTEETTELLDVTGMVHWCTSKSIEECCLTIQDAISMAFENHVIVCLNADENSPEIGLVNFVTPLRASTLQHHEIKDIVIVGKKTPIENEWSELRNFPNIYLIPQSRDKRLDLRAANVHRCSMCVILTAGGHITVDENLIDKEAIVTTLTIKSMFGTSLERRIKTVGVLTNPEKFRRNMIMAGDIPLITELEHDANVAYLDADDDDDPSIPLHLTTPYICGKTFVGSVLDSLVSCTYLNGDVLTLIRALVTGGETAEFEKILSEGLGIVRKNSLIDVSSARRRSRLAQHSLSNGPLEKLNHEHKYGALFKQALGRYNIICLGLYRLINPESNEPCDRQRAVLCNPRHDLELLNSDRVFVLQPYQMSLAYAFQQNGVNRSPDNSTNSPVDDVFRSEGTTQPDTSLIHSVKL